MPSSDPPCIVRLAVPSDADSIARAHVLGWQAAYRGLVPDSVLDGLSVERRTAFWTEVIARPRNPRQRTWVAEICNAVVGFINTGPSRDHDGTGLGELRAIYALPDYWSAGVGHALHEACINGLSGDGFTSATLWVLKDNARALKFYARHGWSPDGASKLEEFDGAMLNEIRLRRAI